MVHLNGGSKSEKGVHFVAHFFPHFYPFQEPIFDNDVERIADILAGV